MLKRVVDGEGSVCPNQLLNGCLKRYKICLTKQLKKLFNRVVQNPDLKVQIYGA